MDSKTLSAMIRFTYRIKTVEEAHWIEGLIYVLEKQIAGIGEE